MLQQLQIDLEKVKEQASELQKKIEELTKELEKEKENNKKAGGLSPVLLAVLAVGLLLSHFLVYQLA